jgi:hypothetical protein
MSNIQINNNFDIERIQNANNNIDKNSRYNYHMSQSQYYSNYFQQTQSTTPAIDSLMWLRNIQNTHSSRTEYSFYN